jgi:hypothetical protein
VFENADGACVGLYFVIVHPETDSQRWKGGRVIALENYVAMGLRTYLEFVRTTIDHYFQLLFADRIGDFLAP